MASTEATPRPHPRRAARVTEPEPATLDRRAGRAGGSRSLALLSQGLLHSLNYFETVDQVFASRASIGTKVIRLEGVVKPHTDRAHRQRRVVRASPVEAPRGLRRRARLAARSSSRRTSRSSWSATSRRATSSTFDGTQILVKHTSTYIAQHPRG